METKFKIIETSDYILAVSDEEIKEDDYCINFFKSNDYIDAHTCSIIKRNYLKSETFDNFLKIIAYQPKGNAPELDLPLLPEIVVEDEVEKLAKNSLRKQPWDTSLGLPFNEGYKKGFMDGYNSSTKTYSEEDLRKAIELSRINYKEKTFGTVLPKYKPGEIVNLVTQSKPKLFVAEIEYYYHSSKEFYFDADFVKCSKEQYENIKKEIPTCPLKIELKTTTINNKTYLVGHYE
jgi:hypothetical protein